MTARIPYLDLTADEKLALHQWLTDHHVDYKRVPVYAQFQHDQATGEWRIPVYLVSSNGRLRIDLATNEVLQRLIRRRELRPLPWPELRHGPVEGSDFMPAGWCGACDACASWPAPKVCIVCSYDADGMPAKPVDWPCALAAEEA